MKEKSAAQSHAIALFLRYRTEKVFIVEAPKKFVISEHNYYYAPSVTNDTVAYALFGFVGGQPYAYGGHTTNFQRRLRQHLQPGFFGSCERLLVLHAEETGNPILLENMIVHILRSLGKNLGFLNIKNVQDPRELEWSVVKTIAEANIKRLSGDLLKFRKEYNRLKRIIKKQIVKAFQEGTLINE
ncbi:MAG: hypothetical protein ACKVIO_00140 [Phycisphaerales bacterium]|jgi:hypothetical protein|tara:strand:- start:560 stop:1114 length:555 start_codon:yes stop_codon:yes gene_type:complete